MRRLLLVSLTAVLVSCSAPPASSSVAPTATEAPSESPSTTPAASASATEAPAVAGVLGEGVISTDDEEYRISFSPDGRLAYFSRSSAFFPQSRQAEILETRLVDGAWSEPSTASFSGTYPDLDPWCSPDGQSIYFSSIRPVEGEERSDVELFRVDRSGDGWSDPVHLAELGSGGDELGASVAADGSIWFASDRQGGAGGWDLYAAVAEGDGFAAPEPVEELNSPVWEFNPAIDAEGTTLVFTSIDREGGSGLGDLFVTTREGDAWSEAVPLAINSTSDEYHASRSPDGSTLYFVRRQGDGDLFEIDWQEVDPAG